MDGLMLHKRFFFQLQSRNTLKWHFQWFLIQRELKSSSLNVVSFLAFSPRIFIFNFELVFQTCNKMKSKTAIKGRYETYQLPEFNFMTSNYVNNVSFSSTLSPHRLFCVLFTKRDVIKVIFRAFTTKERKVIPSY